MESYRKNENHSVNIDVQSLIKNEFGNFYVNDEGFYVVSDPDQSVLQEVKIKLKEESVILEIEEVPLELARKKNIVSDVEDAIKSKNKVLNCLTGRSVENRKTDLRQSVIDEEATETSIEFGDS